MCLSTVHLACISLGLCHRACLGQTEMSAAPQVCIHSADSSGWDWLHFTSVSVPMINTNKRGAPGICFEQKPMWPSRANKANSAGSNCLIGSQICPDTGTVHLKWTPRSPDSRQLFTSNLTLTVSRTHRASCMFCLLCSWLPYGVYWTLFTTFCLQKWGLFDGKRQFD